MIVMKKLTDIPHDRKYVGYLWMSDSVSPKIYSDPTSLEQELLIREDENPFIVEGQLYCKDKDGFEKSYHIKYIDGEYWVAEYDLNEIRAKADPNDQGVVKSFISNRMQCSKLKFEQYWEAVPDELCEGMEVLNPGPFVFVGFEK